MRCKNTKKDKELICVNTNKSSLQTLIECIEKNTSAHVCIHDVSGILQNDMLAVSEKNHMHYSPVCNIAKTTDKGFRLCFACKGLSIKKAIDGASAYMGTCPLGLTEIALPVFINDKPVCIIYIGNLNCDSAAMAAKVKRVCRLTGVDENLLLNALPPEISVSEAEHFVQAAGVVKNYISLVCASYDLSADHRMHWAVKAMCDYADQYYQKTLSIGTLAKIYYMNENYLGRLFKKHMGKSFSAYLNDIRIKRACHMLRHTDNTVISIALECGFNNVTYFNKVFKKSTGYTPGEYKNII